MTFLALEELTAANLNAAFTAVTTSVTAITPLFVRKTSDETVNNSAVLQNDDALLLAMSASSTYLLDLRLIVNSGTTPDFKFTFTVPASTTGSIQIFEGSTPSTAAAVLQGPFSLTATSATSGIAGDQIILVQGVVVVSSTAGNLQFQWAQNTANASDTKVKANSYMMLQKVA